MTGSTCTWASCAWELLTSKQFNKTVTVLPVDHSLVRFGVCGDDRSIGATLNAKSFAVSLRERCSGGG